MNDRKCHPPPNASFCERLIERSIPGALPRSVCLPGRRSLDWLTGSEGFPSQATALIIMPSR